MGFSEKHQPTDHHGNLMELEGNNKKCVIAGIPLRAPLKPIHTKTTKQVVAKKDHSISSGEEATTPTGEESRISSRMTCPPSPRKRKATLRCSRSNSGGGVREFFTPPDLESVFIRHVERVK